MKVQKQGMGLKWLKKILGAWEQMKESLLEVK